VNEKLFPSQESHQKNTQLPLTYAFPENYVLWSLNITQQNDKRMLKYDSGIETKSHNCLAP